MNKKILLPLLVLAVIPVIGFGLIPDDADRLGKEFAANYPGATIGVHSLEEEISEQEEVDRASLIIEGTIIETDTYWKIVRSDSPPRIFTDFTVKVDEVIKGESKKIVKVTMSGGEKDGVTTYTEGSKIKNGDKVIMILGQDISSVFGDSYTPISISKSTYVIDDDEKANNKINDRSDNKDKVKERILKLTQN